MKPIELKDARGKAFAIVVPPRRIVSLVPSDTFSVAALGAADRLVGRTEYCELPADVAAGVPAVGGTKNPRVADILDLAPDLVLANQEENTRSDVEALDRAGLHVYVAFPLRVAEGIAHLARLARVLAVEGDPSVQDLVRRGYQAVREAEGDARLRAPLRVFCPIWLDPLMTVHGRTFVSDMLALCGMQNVFADRSRRYPLAADLGAAAPLSADRVGDRDTRYPRVTAAEVAERAPEAVVLPDEPYAFTERDAPAFRAMAPGVRAVVCTSGKDLTWYGAYSVDAIGRVRALRGAICERRPG